MKKSIKTIVIIQQYNTPYRNELFNQISSYKDINLYLVYISQRSLDRKWTEEFAVDFKEIQIKCKIKHLSYENNFSQINYFDLISKMYAINPDIIISVLSRITIILKYTIFWKKVKLIHWSEVTMAAAQGKKYHQSMYESIHKNYPSAYIFPGRLAFDFHKLCGLGLNKENVFYAPNSVDNCFSITKEEIEIKFNNPFKLKLLYIGSFIKLKNFDGLLNAFNIVMEKFSNVEVHVAGDGPIKPGNNIINHGFISKDDSVELYKSCHVFIMPSIYDCNPLSVIEAAKCGCALLLSDGVGNYPELIDGNGYVFERGNTSAIVGSLEKILTSSMSELKTMALRSSDLSLAHEHQNSAGAFYDAINYVSKWSH
jgi:glycosyltransferase involved in cell wall biosynthesis